MVGSNLLVREISIFCGWLLQKIRQTLVESEAGASKPEILIKQFRRPAQGTITRSFSQPATPGERLFAPKCL